MGNNDNKAPAALAMMFSGIALGAMVTLLSLSDGVEEFILISSIALGTAGVCFLVKFILESAVMPRAARRNAAARALGKEGIKIMRRDTTAKLAFKGIYAIMDGKYPQAEEYLQQALANSDIRQNQMFCIEWLIRLYDAMDNESKLLWCYRKAVEYSPDNPEAQSRLGHAYFADGKLDQALYCFEQALRYDPNNGYSYFSIAKIQLVRGQDKQAFETLQKLVRINENHPLCHAELADYYAMQGNREMAEEECKKAQLCGIKDPDELNKRINAMLSFHETEFSGGDLPTMFYRRIEDTAERNAAHKGGAAGLAEGGSND